MNACVGFRMDYAKYEYDLCTRLTSVFCKCAIIVVGIDALPVQRPNAICIVRACASVRVITCVFFLFVSPTETALGQNVNVRSMLKPFSYVSFTHTI